MNKKVSTLLTCGLMLGGSLLASTAFAQTTLPIGDKVSASNKLKADGSTTYFIVQDNGSATVGDSPVLGMQWADALTQKKVEFLVRDADVTISGDYNRFLWTVESSSDGGKYAYIFTNVATGQKLTVDNNSGAFDQMELDIPADSDDATKFSFGIDQKSYESGSTSKVRLLVQSTLNDGDDTNDKALSIGDNDAVKVVGRTEHSANHFNLYSVKDTEIANPDGLNALYNLAGFNFEIEEGVTNIFADGKIKAIKVEDGDAEWGEQVSGEYPYSFPAGTYFAVKTPSGDYSTMSATEKKNYLLGCTFIAVSPSSNVADDAGEQAAGRGFTLTTVLGQDLNCYTEVRPGAIDTDEQTSGNDISVFNACFEGWENAGVADKYALALKNVRYQAKADDMAHAQKSLALNVIKVHYGSTKYLATSDYATNNFVFTLAKTSAIDPVEAKILNESGAAIYNIQIVSGDETDDASEYNKYLTVSTKDNGYWAKGSALADLNTPAFEFVISKVVDKNITFTNRETGMSFTTMLYPETAKGEGIYSIAPTTSIDYSVADVKDNGDVEADKTANLSQAYIKLIPVASVDKFDGYMNVEDETIMTLTLARDMEPTSNKYYPTVNTTNTAFEDLTDEVSEAVQWQLVKATKEPTYKAYDYYYIKDGKATIKNAGDTVAVQSYKLQLVVDGQTKDKYLTVASNPENEMTLGTTGTDFYIKYNVDGSVAIKNGSFNGKSAISVSDYRAEMYGTANGTEFGTNDYLRMRDVAEDSKAIEVKTYLVSDAPVISWQNQGHATLQSEEGLYITMEENNDGKVNSIEPETFYLTKTDTNKAIPSFYISKGINGDAATERMYLFNPVDSIPYLVNAPVDTRYEWDEETTKAIFKAGTLLTPDTMKTIIKAEETVIAQKADNEGVEGGLNRFKFQIIEDEENSGYYYIRQTNSPIYNKNGVKTGEETLYLRNLNGKLTWTKSSATKAERVKVAIEEVAAPTANESVSASEVKVIAVDGAINIKNAAGKNVVVSTILGQIVANEVLTSDNATISVPAGIAIVSVDGEEAVKVCVK